MAGYIRQEADEQLSKVACTFKMVFWDGSQLQVENMHL